LSIKDDKELLNLDVAQINEADKNIDNFNRTVDDQIREAYCWLLVPYIDKENDMKTIVWDATRISGGTDSIIAKAAKKMLQNEQVITKWAPALLLMELDNLLWRDADHIAVKTLWDYLCTYCYLPRLANEDVLTDTILTGLNSAEYFAFASAFDSDGARYIDLKFNQYLSHVERSGYLVKVAVAKKQLDEEEAKRQAEAAAKAAQSGSAAAASAGDGTAPSYIYPTSEAGTGAPQVQDTPEQPKNKRFYMSAQLDTTRIGRDVQKLVEEVISHIASTNGAKVEVTLEVNAQVPDGLSQETARTVSENCQTLKVQSFGFEE
jgi:hypothetical protein